MNLFWVFVPGILILGAGLIVFERQNRKQQLTEGASVADKTSEKSKK